MPTVDITAPAGAFTPAAVGDTQELTTTWTISSGSSSLTCNGTAPFVSGDTGKAFTLAGAGASGAYLSGTLTYISANQVALSVTAGTALSASTEYFAWGTDDAPAFEACNTWAQAQSGSITVNMGTGAHSFLLGTVDVHPYHRANSLVWNVPGPITIQGNGPTNTKIITGAGDMCLGSLVGILTGGATVDTARLQTATAGSTTITCKNPSDTSYFSTNTYALLAGIDLQGYGQPVNPYYFEYVYITAINAGTGVITLQSPIVNTYLSTWPVWSPGGVFSPDEGGPATLFAINPPWNINATYSGITFNNQASGNQTYAPSYSVSFVNCVWADSIGLTPTNNNLFSTTGCDLSSYLMEFDKDIVTAIFDSTTFGQVLFQSSGGPVTFQNGCNITRGINCTPGNLIIDNSTVNGILIGPFGYGRVSSITIRNNSTITTSGGHSTGIANGFTYTTSTMTMNRGVITIPNSGGSQAFLVPGTRMSVNGTYTPSSYSIGWGPMLMILSVTQDASNVYAVTDWPYSGWPFWAGNIRMVPSLYLSVDSTTITTDPLMLGLIAATSAGHTIPGTYAYNGGLNGSNIAYNSGNGCQIFPTTGGQLVSLTINVTTPYTGIHGSLYLAPEFDRGFVIDKNMNVQQWAPHIDLKTAGKRVITLKGPTSGPFGADSNLTPPANTIWLSGFEHSNVVWVTNVDVSSEYNGNPSVGPVLTFELILDQTQTYDTSLGAFNVVELCCIG